MTEQDQELLGAVLEREDLSDNRRVIFEDMLHRLERYGRPLTDKQRAFVQAALKGEKYNAEPEYENTWSAGKVPEGRKVATPAVLQNLPKRPPPFPKP
jgi:hypothetical protein